MKSSVIIRVKNEEENLRKLLKILQDQTDQDFEVIIVNDNSSDNSDRAAFDFFPRKRTKVVNIPKGKFTYPYASNLGAKTAKGDYLVYLSAHSFPVSDSWLEDGLKNFADPKVAGIFAYPVPHENEGLITKILQLLWVHIYSPKNKKYFEYKKGVLGTSNAIIRKKFWIIYNFSESYAEGGEDADWARHFFKEGYSIVQDHRLRTFHSHHLSVIKFFKQSFHYYQLAKQRN